MDNSAELKDLDLLSRIKMVRTAAEVKGKKLLCVPERDKFIWDLINAYERHISNSNPPIYKTNKRRYLLSSVLYGETTFREEYAKDGLTEELSDLIGKVYSDQALEELSSYVSEAMKIEVAEFLWAQLKSAGFEGTPLSEDKPPVQVYEPWNLRLDKLGFVSGPFEKVIIEGKSGFFVGSGQKCLNKAIKLAKKRRYDIFVVDKELIEDSGYKRSCTFSFYRLDDRIYNHL